MGDLSTDQNQTISFFTEGQDLVAPLSFGEAPGSVGNLFYVPILDLGFRYQKPGKGFLFRAKAGSFGIGTGYSF